MKVRGLPEPQGLYTPENEHDNCGVGFLANIKNRKSHDIIRQGLEILVNLDHRGAVGADELAGDGAGILLQVPDRLFREDCSRERARAVPPLPKRLDAYEDAEDVLSVALAVLMSSDVPNQVIRFFVLFVFFFGTWISNTMWA